MKRILRNILVFAVAMIMLVSAGIAGTSEVYAASGSWKQNSKGWWYEYSDGSYAAGTWEQIGGKWYHFSNAGYMQTGWLKSGGKWYFMNGSGAMQTGWVKSGGEWYYMNSSGVMQTGWVKSGGKWYYMNGSGAMQTGWVKSGGKWYYMNGSGAMQTGNQTIGGKVYYFNEDGIWTDYSWLVGTWSYDTNHNVRYSTNVTSVQANKITFNTGYSEYWLQNGKKVPSMRGASTGSITAYINNNRIVFTFGDSNVGGSGTITLKGNSIYVSVRQRNYSSDYGTSSRLVQFDETMTKE